jgi:hypothetical protein
VQPGEDLPTGEQVRRRPGARLLALGATCVAGGLIATAALIAQPAPAPPTPPVVPTGTATAQGAPVPSVLPPAPTAAAGDAGDAVTDGRRALSALLQRREQAVQRRDRAAWLAEVDPGSVQYAQRQAAAFDGLAAVPLAAWSYRIAADRPALAPTRQAALGRDAWLAHVLLRYRVDGFDAADVERHHYLTVVRRDGRWLLADDTDGASAGRPTERDIWDLGPVHAARGRSSLVLGPGPESTLARHAAEADRAVTAVDGLWTGAWPHRVVLLAPQTLQQMAALAGLSEDGLAQLAAVTTGRVTGSGPTTGDRIVLNPQTFAGLVPTARRVVLAHETTHVATRTLPRGDVPLWLAEGLADYVGYRGSGVPVRVAAADLIGRVRDGRGPTRLPTEQDFDPRRGDVSAAYNGAWLAARMIAQRHGEKALVELYLRAAAQPDGLEDGLRRLGTDEQRFTRDWLAYVAAVSA